MSKYLELKMSLDHTQEFDRFSRLLSGDCVHKELHFKYHITGNVFLTYDNSFSQVKFFVLLLPICNCFMCFFELQR